MIYEGSKISIGFSMWKILDAMNYNRRVMNNIDIIYNMEEPDTKWIYKGPDNYNK